MAEAKLITNKIQNKRYVQLGFNKLSRSLLFKFLRHLEIGTLTIHDKGEVFKFGKDSSIEASVVVKDPRFYGRLLSSGSIGSGESFVEGWWESSDTTKVIEVFAANLPALDKLEKSVSWFTYPLNNIARWLTKNTKKKAKSNIMAHYDLGNELYTRFLDSTMSYSSAIFESSTDSLYEASLNKLRVVCERLELSRDDHLLEIGTGWGGLAIFAAQKYGCRVTTTTISEEQYAYACEKVKALGLSDKITLLKKDYRDLTGEYDKLVSIEMIEAVGHEFLPVYLEHCNRLLKTNGKLLIQSILIDHERYDLYSRSQDFIQKYIFPGGHLPSVEVIEALVDQHTQLDVEQVEKFGLDYAKTLAAWYTNFNSNWSEIKNFGYDDKFHRLWNFYFHYCEGGFLQKRIDVAHFVMRKTSG